VGGSTVHLFIFVYALDLCNMVCLFFLQFVTVMGKSDTVQRGYTLDTACAEAAELVSWHIYYYCCSCAIMCTNQPTNQLTF
jgi:hypothetical protein